MNDRVMEDLQSTGRDETSAGDLDEDVETTQHLANMYDLYGLGADIAEISFNLLDSSPEVSLLTLLKSSASAAVAPKSYEISIDDASCNLKMQEGTVTWLPSKSPFAHANAQLPDQMMYAPMDYFADQLAFPDYMMVHSHSGLPVLLNDPANPITTNALTYGGASYMYHSLDDGPFEKGDSLLSPDLSYHFQTSLFGQNMVMEMGNSVAARYVHSENPKVEMPTNLAHTVKQQLPSELHLRLPKKRGRPKKEEKLVRLSLNHDKPPVERHHPVDEKENLPCSEDEVTSLTSDEEENTGDDCQIPFDELNCKPYPKPPYSYSALVTLALKNSKTGRLTVRDIYNFMCNHFPYFRTAPSGWKNSVRHNLSLNPAFLKIVGESGPARARTACRWTMNPDRYRKMNDEIGKFRGKALGQITDSMRNSDLLKSLEEGTFSDFSRAIRGVTVQEKKAGQRRRKIPNKNDGFNEEVQLPVVPRFFKMETKDESSVDSGSYQSFYSLNGKPRSPFTIRPSSPATSQFGCGSAVSLQCARARGESDICWQ